MIKTRRQQRVFKFKHLNIHTLISNFKFQISNYQKGFTLIEIIIAIAILVIIMGLGLFVAFDFYRSYSFHSERSIIVSALQKARNQSLNNINQARHGVRFAAPLQYIIFECPFGCTSYTANPATDIPIAPSYGLSVTGTPFDVIFDQLSGTSTDRTITVSDGARSYDISVNSEGRIDW